MNCYSRQWFEFFHETIPSQRTDAEVAFIAGWAPLPDFRRVLDVCCGMGRHARALAQRGYVVTGIERNQAAIARAEELGGGPTYILRDVREYTPDRERFDLAIVMSQSFGYFDAATNRSLLGRLAAGLRVGGRIILDLWNPEFFVAHQGDRDLETSTGVVRETKAMRDRRLVVDLRYPNGTTESFDWELFTPTEMRSLAERVGLDLLTECTDMSAEMKPGAANPRIQFVLETATEFRPPKSAAP